VTTATPAPTSGRPSSRPAHLLAETKGFAQAQVQVKTAGAVTVVPYDVRWVRLFEEASRELAAVLGPAILGVHHVGSTSVAPRVIQLGIKYLF